MKIYYQQMKSSTLFTDMQNKFPDDYNKEEFKTPLNEISMLDQGSQIWSQCNSQNENDEIETLYVNETERNQHLELIRFYEMIDK